MKVHHKILLILAGIGFVAAAVSIRSLSNPSIFVLCLIGLILIVGGGIALTFKK